MHATRDTDATLKGVLELDKVKKYTAVTRGIVICEYCRKTAYS